jgi:hypothetical protein
MAAQIDWVIPAITASASFWVRSLAVCHVSDVEKDRRACDRCRRRAQKVCLRVVHDRREQRIIAGCRQYWTYQAIDDPAEVMTLQEIDTREHAQAWLSHPEARREFLESAGVGIYPDTFVGRLVEAVDIEPAPGV